MPPPLRRGCPCSRPRFGAGVERIAHAGHLGRVKICPARGKAAGIGHLFGNDSIRADINVIKRQAALARCCPHTPFRPGLHPLQIELAVALLTIRLRPLIIRHLVTSLELSLVQPCRCQEHIGLVVTLPSPRALHRWSVATPPGTSGALASLRKAAVYRSPGRKSIHRGKQIFSLDDIFVFFASSIYVAV